jgi:hypothetical protein
MNEIEVTNRFKKFVDSKYFLCSPDPLKDGWDCLNMLADYYGACFPRTFEDWDDSNYGERWLKDEKKAREVLRRFLLSLGTEINVNYAMPGDLMLFENEIPPFTLKRPRIPMFPGIYQGNNHVIINWGRDKGIKVVLFDPLKPMLISVRRLF